MLKNEDPDTYVIILTNNNPIEIALEPSGHGASDYIGKTEVNFRKINFSLLMLLKSCKLEVM